MRNLGAGLLLWCVALPCFAATWYVRPAADCATNGNGTAYACAIAGGGAGAWSEPTNIVWGSVAAGDTVTLCGTFHAGSGGTHYFSSGASGSAGNPITITGNCAAAGGPSRSILDGDGVRFSAFNSNTSTYLTISNLEIRNFTARGLYLTDASDVPATSQQTVRNIVVDSVYIHDITLASASSPNAIFAHGRNITVQNSTLSNIGDDAITVMGKSFTARNVAIDHVSLSGATGDCISIGGTNPEMDGYLLDGDTCDHTNLDVKQCWVIALASGASDNPTGTIKNSKCYMPTGATSAFGAMINTGSGTIQSSYFSGGNYGIDVSNSTGYTHTIVGNIVENSTNSGIHANFAGSTQTVNIYNNTVVNPALYGINNDSASTTVTARNNIVKGATSSCLKALGNGIVNSYNDLAACSTTYLVISTPTATGTGTITSDPQFIGGTGAAAYKLKATSPALGAGTFVGAFGDYLNHAFRVPPSIGAFEQASGDQVTRTAASIARTKAASERTTAAARTDRL